MTQLVDIRLRRRTRVERFVVRDILLEAGDKCIVRSDKGLEMGVCIAPPQDCDEAAAQRMKASVVRKATYKDDLTLEQLLTEEEKAWEICAKKIEQRGLPMKLVDVEYTFDKHKVVFCFTAEDRVDFRELVRDLARELRTRIELRHIQIRDQAKLVGGLAACGRELCCSMWLKDFAPISMKMAKRQNLSLNPSKISGQCGRLMCCLSYENDQYEDPKRRKKRLAEEQRAAAPPQPEREDSMIDDQLLSEEESVEAKAEVSGHGAKVYVQEAAAPDAGPPSPQQGAKQGEERPSRPSSAEQKLELGDPQGQDGGPDARAGASGDESSQRKRRRRRRRSKGSKPKKTN